MLKTRFEDILASNDKKIEQLSEKALASDIISNELYENTMSSEAYVTIRE